MNIRDALQELRTKPLVDLWPTVGLLFDISRPAVYDAARRGEIETVRIGRLRKAVSAPLRKKLQITEK
jgi:hypothetical protein